MAHGIEIRTATSAISISDEYPSFHLSEIHTTQVVSPQVYSTINFSKAYVEQPLLFLRYASSVVVTGGQSYTLEAEGGIRRWIKDAQNRYIGAETYVNEGNTVCVYAKMDNSLADNTGYGFQIFNSLAQPVFQNAYKLLKITYVAALEYNSGALDYSVTPIYGTKPANNTDSMALLNSFHSGLVVPDMRYDSTTYANIHVVDGAGGWSRFSAESLDSDTQGLLNFSWKTLIMCARY